MAIVHLDFTEAISYCTKFSCSCPLGNNLWNITCVPLCPTGYYLNATNCFVDTTSSLSLFHLEFFRYWDFADEKIGNFSLKSNSSILNGTSIFPIFTKDRGFYFRKATQITSQVSWLLAPSFTVRFIFKVFNEGVIFKIHDFEGIYVDINIEKQKLCISLMLTEIKMINNVTGQTQESGGVAGEPYTPVYNNSIEKHCSEVSYNKWTIITIFTLQTTDSISIKTIQRTEKKEESRLFVQNKDFLAQKNDLKYTLGDTALGFSGFLYEIILDNFAVSIYNQAYKFVDCDFGLFYDYSENVCSYCSESLRNKAMSFIETLNITLSEYLAENYSDLALCTKKESFCYSSDCLNCSGFSYKSCSTCKIDPLEISNTSNTTNSSTQPEVTNCNFNFFSTSNCSSNLELIVNKSICAYKSSFDSQSNSSNPVFSLKFDSFDNLYSDLFQSGTKSSKFDQLKRSDLDPYPVKGRGIYFSGYSYLESVQNISLNFEFTISLWAWPANSTLVSNLWFSNNLEIMSDGVGKFCFFDGISKYCESSYANVIMCSNWLFISFSIIYNQTTQTSSVSRIIDSKIESLLSIPSHIFLNEPSKVLIGKGIDYYIGFIYELHIWNELYDPQLYYNSFCLGPVEYRASDYGKDYFYNNITKKYELCELNCTQGCVEWGRCSLCREADCSECSNFKSDCSIFQSSTCLDGLNLTEKKHCCYELCKECKGSRVFDCISCDDSHFLTDGVCFEKCPIGYLEKERSCLKNRSKSLDVIFDFPSTYFTDNISSITFGEIGSAFSTFNESDPIPSMKRGLYFNKHSYIHSDKFILPFSFMISLFIKVIEPGNIFKKTDFQLSFNTEGIQAVMNDYYFYQNTTIWNEWVRLVIGLNTTSNITTQMFINLKGLTLDLFNKDIWFIDKFDSLILGGESSFTGFIYRLVIYSSGYLSSLSDSLLISCVSSDQNDCLSMCKFTEFQNLSDCSNCSNCKYGCHTDEHCNPCLSDHCLNCDSFNGSCLECDSPDYILHEGKCACAARKYLNKTDCLDCDYNCLECEKDAKNCTNCGTFSKIVNNSCSCIEGFVEDKNENYTYFNCKCPNNSILNETDNKSCICNFGHVKINNLCQKCHERCETCFGIEYFQCLTCINVVESGICKEDCSLGYKNNMGKCEKISMPQGIFKLKFDELKLPDEDQISGIGVKYSGKRKLAASPPNPIFLRGIYFDGLSTYVKFPSPSVNFSILSSSFFLSFWLNPLKPENFLLYQIFKKEKFLSLSFSSEKIVVTLNAGGNQKAFTSESNIILNKWNSLSLSVDFYTKITASFILNNDQRLTTADSIYPYEDNVGSTFYIGTNNFNFFLGFLYSFTIFNEIPSLSLIESQVTLCAESYSTSCITSCNITSYFDFDYNLCLSCDEKCKNGCRSNDSCTQCFNSHCKICESFYSNCSECEVGFELLEIGCIKCDSLHYYDKRSKKCKLCEEGTFIVEGKCIECELDEYFDSLSQMCKKCQSFCTKCYSEFNCSSCIKNAYLGADLLCYCYKGYDPKNNCSYIQTFFMASMKISSENIIKIQFSEVPIVELNRTSINVILDSSSVDFLFYVISRSEYIIEPKLPEKIHEGTKIIINIIESIISVNNSILSNNELKSVLYPKDISNMRNLIGQAKALAQLGVYSGLSAAIGTGVTSFDPTSFFSFLSTAEMYYPISLFDLDLPEDLCTFLASLRVQSMIPNAFSYWISKDDGSKLPEKFIKLGFKSNLLLVNIGVNLGIGIIFLILMIFIKIISYNFKMKPFVKKIKQMFEYGIFLKFWVQSYLEFLLGAIITIKYNNFANPLENFDFFLGIVVIVRHI